MSATRGERLLAAIAATGMLTIREVCARAGIHRLTLEKHIKAGHLAAERRTLFGTSVFLFAQADVERYVATVDGLRRSSAKEMLEEADRQSLVTARDLCSLAGVSRPTLIKHHKTGLIKGESRRLNGRSILVFEAAEAERYASVAREIVKERTEANILRGALKAPDGYITAAALAKRSRRTIFFVYDRIKGGELQAKTYKTALIITLPDAERFVTRHGLVQPPAGMVTITEARKLTGIPEKSIVNAIENGLVAAIPARNAAASEGRTTGRAKTLVAIEDVRQYAGSSRRERDRKKELVAMARDGRTLVERLKQ